MTIRVGNIVRPLNGELRSGSEAYGGAVCVSVDPFILVSEHADMRWESKNIEDFIYSGHDANDNMLAKCMMRLDDRTLDELVDAIDGTFGGRTTDIAVDSLVAMIRGLTVQNNELKAKLSTIRNAVN